MKFAALLAAAFVAGCSGHAPPERAEWTVMGTVAAVQWRGGDGRAVADAVRRTFSEVESLLNAHDPDSELSRLASLPDAEVLRRCSAIVRPCYEAAFRLQRDSGGAFNPRWRGAGTMDLGAIAKGFAVDLAADAAAAAPGAGDVLIDLGGNLKAVRGSWRVGVYSPEIGRADHAFVLHEGEACATSGEYARGRHIRDGRTGAAVADAAGSATVIHPSSAMLADGLSTLLFVLGRDKGGEFLETRYPGARAVWQPPVPRSAEK